MYVLVVVFPSPTVPVKGIAAPTRAENACSLRGQCMGSVWAVRVKFTDLVFTRINFACNFTGMRVFKTGGRSLCYSYTHLRV